MCYPAKCKTCAKVTWAGDGQHIDTVRGTVAAAQWCTGHAGQQKTRGILSKLFVSASSSSTL